MANQCLRNVWYCIGTIVFFWLYDSLAGGLCRLPKVDSEDLPLDLFLCVSFVFVNKSIPYVKVIQSLISNYIKMLDIAY